MDATAKRLARSLERLYARVPLGMRLGLEAMRAACERAGNPESAFDCVHVAGTNGKGSVSAMIASVSRASGRRTGLYTSPHLARFAERIRIGGEPISDADLVTVLERALDVGHDLSFFETATLAAFFAFRDAGVELAVLEVGLGGRLDATNVIARSRASVITRIALDHEDRLGHTLPEIAREKAAIAKPGCPLLVGRVPPDVREAIAGVAEPLGASVQFLDDVARETIPALPHLPGAYQADNAEVAWLACRTLGLDAHVERGLREARWPGRFERLTTPEGDVLLDAAHNEDGALALVASLAAEARPGNEPSPVALVFGSLADKHFVLTLPVVARIAVADARFYVEPKGRAAAPPSALSKVAQGHEMPSLSEALRAARARVGKGGLVVVCGSVYLVGEARALLLGEPTDPPVAL